LTVCGGAVEAPTSLWGALSLLAAAAVAGGGEVRVPRSRCISDLAAGLRLLGYNVAYVASDKLVIEESGEARGGRVVARGPCTHQLVLLSLLAAARLGPSRRLVIHSKRVDSRVARWIVEAASLLGARAWPLEGGHGLLVEGGVARRTVVGRLYTGWLPLLAAMVYAAVSRGQSLYVALSTSELVGWRWFKHSLGYIGLDADAVLRGYRLVLKHSERPTLHATSAWRSGATVLTAILPVKRLGGTIRIENVDSDEWQDFTMAAAQLGLEVARSTCSATYCDAELRPGGGAASAHYEVGPDEPDYLYVYTAALAGGGSVHAPYFYVEDGGLAAAKNPLVVEGGFLTVKSGYSGPISCRDGSPLLCAYAYGLYAYGAVKSPTGIEVLDDRLPGFASAAQQTGCIA